jgi:ATP-dependent Clp protease ATP-binding subunit ClpC
MLQILEEGRLTDGKGQKVSFKDCVVIMTSNVGVTEVDNVKKTVGFGDVAVLTNEKKTKAIDKAIKKKFKPEFINRVDDIIHFNNLKKEDYMRIIDLELYKLNENLQANDTEYKNLTLEFDKKVKAYIYKKGINSDYGARPLKRCIEKEISTKLASALLKEEIDVNSKVTISVKRNKTVFNFEPKEELKDSEDLEENLLELGEGTE